MKKRNVVSANMVLHIHVCYLQIPEVHVLLDSILFGSSILVLQLLLLI